jgi:ceramide glucosyltransferase
MTALAAIATVLAGIGLLQALAGWGLVARFAARTTPRALHRPLVSVLKPLYGDEPLLEAALATICEQDYPDWQVVCGVQSPADPAIAVVRRLQARYPNCDIALVVDPTQHGANRKVGNLINMLPAAAHPVLVIADSDVHVQRDYLERLVATLEEPGTGLVTTLYAGLPANRSLPARLGATQITHGFLPGALLARAFGRQDCLGATMCLRRETLVRVGGFAALVDHLADDNVLGRLVQRLGLEVRLADTVPLTTVPETRLRALFRHELRWARTISALEPAGFAASILQYPLVWALLAVGLSGAAIWSLGVFFIAWTLRALACAGIDRALHHRMGETTFAVPVSLLPLRDLLSVAIMLVSYAGKQVDWRGYRLQADAAPPHEPDMLSLRPAEDFSPR